MKSNPYVYPFIPFEDLSNKEIKDNFVGRKEIAWDDLLKLVSQVKTVPPQIAGQAVAERIFSLFLDDNYRFGPREYLENNRQSWLDQLNFFIGKSEPIKFTILGFPFKVPVPLKTNRKFPDLGDVLALLRLSTINRLIKDLYPPGAVTTIFTEGAFGRFTGVPKGVCDRYRDFLQELVTKSGFAETLVLADLAKMESSVPNFETRYERKIQEFKELYQKGDPSFLEKYRGTYDSLYRIVATEGDDEKTLLDVYNDELPDDQVSLPAREVRSYLRKKAHETIFKYHAYLAVRDDLDYIQKTVPHSLPLSVSPKPNRLGVIAVHRECRLLPHHGVTVFYPGKDLYLIEYLIDLKRRGKSFTPVFLISDPDDKPFYYLAN